MNAKRKGKRGELEWADVLRSYGLSARRGQQHSGSPDSPDVVCEHLPNVHFEVKRLEACNVYRAIDQAKADAGGKVPVIAHRRNGDTWWVTLPAEEWLRYVAKPVLQEDLFAAESSAHEVLAYLNAKTGRNFRGPLDLIQRRIYEVDNDLDGIKAMIDRKVAEWTGTMAKYLRPSTLFRKSKFAEYYAMRYDLNAIREELWCLQDDQRMGFSRERQKRIGDLQAILINALPKS